MSNNYWNPENDDDFKNYSSADIGDNPARGGNESESESSSSKTTKEQLDILCTGFGDYHKTQIEFSWGAIKDQGMQAGKVKEMLKYFANMWKNNAEDKDRWLARYNDIDRIVDDAVRKYGKRFDEDNIDWKNIVIEDIIEGKVHNKLVFPIPPGRLGDLVNQIYDMQVYQYKELAFVTAIGMLAGIVGRRFNVGIGRKKQGLNMYLSILMGTGMGKEQISEIVYDTLMRANKVGKGKEFIGAVRFTAGKKLLMNLIHKRSHLCIFTEAGLLMQSKAGDQASLTKTLLEIYGKSGRNSWKGEEGYSKDEDNIPPIRSPALSMISESTPSTILNELHKGNNLENGLLPRQSLYRIDVEKPLPNFDAKDCLNEIHLNKINQLIELCVNYQSDMSESDILVNMFTPAEDDEDFRQFANQCVVLERMYKKQEDFIRHAMSSRVFMKVMKYAAIATLYNCDELPDRVNCDLLYGKEEWIWAKNIVMYELDNVISYFKDSNFDNPIEGIIINVVGPTIFRMIAGEYNTDRIKLTKEEIKNQTIPFKKLSQALNKNKELEKISGVMTSIEGLEKILLFMEQMGYIEKIEVPASKYVQRNKHIGFYKSTDVFIIKASLIDVIKDGVKGNKKCQIN